MMFRSKNAIGKQCPLVGGPCIKEACEHWEFMPYEGVDPRTGQPWERAGCVFKHNMILLMALGQEVRQQAAAVESERNNMVAGHVQLAAAMKEGLDAMGQGLASLADQISTLNMHISQAGQRHSVDPVHPSQIINGG